VVAVNHGTLYAIQPGSAIVSAIVEGKAASVGVHVLDPPITAIQIEGPTGLEVDEIAGFASKITRANDEVLYGPVSWTSSNPGVISVEPGDLWGVALAAHAVGVATITASRDGISASVTLRVTPRATHDLIYNKWTGPASEIYSLGLAVDGAVPVRLNAGSVSRDPSPSPDGTQFVFSVRQLLWTGEWQNDLYVVNRNGMNMRWLTRLSGVEDQPEWSPDGTKILFRYSVDDTTDFYVINVDGTGLTNLTDGLPASMTDKRDPTWSRDGTRIAFIGVVAGQHKVWVMDADGSNARPVTTDAGFDMNPTFSPDGQRIAFVRYNAAVPSLGDDVMIVSAQGGTATRLALAGDQRTPAWSPDGHYIAVSGSSVAGQGASEIYTLRPDGSGLRLRTVNPAWGGGSNPAWISR
jgi:Tol biopolymer transport system component